MLVFKTQDDLKNHLNSISAKTSSLGFVPTMGALHQGHMSLLKQSLTDNDITVISIFVNPTQFNNAGDLDNYPRTLEKDVDIIRQLDASVIIYAPSVEDIYGDHPVATAFDFDGLDKQMEGRHRPGHFDGVGTVVKRLFEIVQPDRAYFGEKDFQQLQIVKKMVQKTGLPVQIVGLDIHRESNGLAMSSRNNRLSALERQQAAMIYQTLQTASRMFPESPIADIKEYVTREFENHDLIKLEYFEIADVDTLEPVAEYLPGKKYRAFIAVFLNDVRLIDTISLN